jgi:Tfp pilus assembly major pilin PilA
MLKTITIKRVGRPFANFHWSILGILILLWEFSLFGQPCKEGPDYFYVALASTTVSFALFANCDLSEISKNWRVVAIALSGTLYDLLSLVLLLIVIGIPIAIFTPHYQCYTPRSRVVTMVGQVSPMREEIGTRILQNKSVTGSGEGLKVKAEGQIKAGFVTKDGAIVVLSENPSAAVMFAPDFDSNGTVTWKCIGSPTKFMPIQCRNE